MRNPPRLKLLPRQKYIDIPEYDPIRFYFLPLIGRIYRRRVELCLAECPGGKRVLEVGFGSGVTFLNLHDIYQEIHGLDLLSHVEKVTKIFKEINIDTYLQNGNILDMPYKNDYFDTVLTISVLEHLKRSELLEAFREIHRVLKPGGHVVYGVPVERPLMVLLFKLMGYNIRDHHFSSEKEVLLAASSFLEKVKVVHMQALLPIFGPIYEIAHLIKR